MAVDGRITAAERATAAKVDMESAAGEMVELLREFGKVIEEGSTDEKRRVIRAFVKEVRLDSDTHGGRAYVLALPDFATVSQALCTGHEKSRCLSATASFQVVAGAGFEPAIFRL